MVLLPCSGESRTAEGQDTEHSRRLMRICSSEVVSRKRAREKNLPTRRCAAESLGLDLGRQTRACVARRSPHRRAPALPPANYVIMMCRRVRCCCVAKHSRALLELDPDF
uniref:Uncharacterized protein n=1 Tax=Heliothis virescens TaxID=7102 RepID=A0A2A4JA48_HELVI